MLPTALQGNANGVRQAAQFQAGQETTKLLYNVMTALKATASISQIKDTQKRPADWILQKIIQSASY
ncbi:MAG: hypothetical protein DBX59_08395 [Bacillota bacterium]|nr:MAG: hypothetical protein DBX59_08395 [Bacillota bacterium]